VRDVFDVMQVEAGAELTSLLADGGASRNNLLMQIQADILGRPILRGTSAEASPLGAAYLAGLATGVWRSLDEIAALQGPRERFEPRLAEQERAALYAGWQAAVARATL
jgi:glycerol kinase